MALPTINVPTYSVKLPSNNTEVKFRPFLVKDQKVLLMALESDSEQEKAEALKNVVRKSILTDVEIDSLPMFDLEYLFLQIRCKSVGEVAEIKFQYNECGKQGQENCVREAEIDLSQVEVNFPEGHTNKIKLTNEVGVKMRYPTAELLDKLSVEQLKDNNLNVIIETVALCVESIWQGDKVFPANEHSLEEMVTFIESLNSEQFKKINNFFETMPRLETEIQVKCVECAKDISLPIRGLSDFFQ